MIYGLYAGIGLKDNFPKFKMYKTGDLIPQSGNTPELELADIDLGDGVSGIILSIFFWIVMAIFFAVLLIIFEAIFWISLFIISTMLYWVFFRALKLVFNRSTETEGIISKSVTYSLAYTILYIGWIFGIVYISELLK